MKKVLIFSLAYYPYVGGAEVAVKEITDRIDPAYIEFHLITLRFNRHDPKEETIGNVHVHRIGMGRDRIQKFIFQFSAAWKALSLHKLHRFDATWALMAHSAGIPAGLFKTVHSEIPYILNLQEGDPPRQIERTMRPLWPLFVRSFTSADIVQPISNFLGRWARERNFTGPIIVIPNGADTRNFEKAAIAHDGIVLITTSRLVYKNAIDDVIRSLRQIRRAHV